LRWSISLAYTPAAWLTWFLAQLLELGLGALPPLWVRACVWTESVLCRKKNSKFLSYSSSSALHFALPLAWQAHHGLPRIVPGLRLLRLLLRDLRSSWDVSAAPFLAQRPPHVVGGPVRIPDGYFSQGRKVNVTPQKRSSFRVVAKALSPVESRRYLFVKRVQSKLLSYWLRSPWVSASTPVLSALFHPFFQSFALLHPFFPVIVLLHPFTLSTVLRSNLICVFKSCAKRHKRSAEMLSRAIPRTAESLFCFCFSCSSATSRFYRRLQTHSFTCVCVWRFYVFVLESSEISNSFISDRLQSLRIAVRTLHQCLGVHPTITVSSCSESQAPCFCSLNAFSARSPFECSTKPRFRLSIAFRVCAVVRTTRPDALHQGSRHFLPLVIIRCEKRGASVRFDVCLKNRKP